MDIKISPIINEIKHQIAHARYQSMSKVNKELIRMYLNIGKTLYENNADSWGKSIIENIAKEVQISFPGIKGFSSRNLWLMMKFYKTNRQNNILQQLVAEIPWGQNLLIMAKIKDDKAKEYYIRKCIEKGWSRAVLEEEIRFDSYKNSRYLQNNFTKILSKDKLALYRSQFSDEYNLSFLGLEETHSEKELEEKIVSNIIQVIGKLGSDFCFMGRQYKVALVDKEYYIDLLFYHRKLKSLIAIELKIDDFKPEYAQQLNWYLHLLDKHVKYAEDRFSIGILICKSKNRLLVEYALEVVTHPIGVATYKYSKLPKRISKYLPSEDQLKKIFEN
ncbi:MAG: PDDEXK nuclease domain-containing protein [bacterium]